MKTSEFEKLLSTDGISKRDGVFTIRRGYFYRNGNTEETFKNFVCKKLDDKNIKYTILDYGDHWAPFRGGASLARSSHFFVKVKILDDCKIGN